VSDAPAPPAPRMNDEEFERMAHLDNDLPLYNEARRARESEEVEARRANGAELLVDAKDAEIERLKADRDAARAGFRDAVEKHRVAVFEKEKAEAERDALRRLVGADQADNWITLVEAHKMAEADNARLRAALFHERWCATCGEDGCSSCSDCTIIEALEGKP